MTDPILQKIIALLREAYHCHTVILYGSHARGDATHSSDYDLLGIRAEGEFERDCRLIDGYYLDAFIYSEFDIKKQKDSLLRIKEGVVLYQKEKLGDELMAQIKQRLQEGPPKTAAWEKHEIEQWVNKMLARAKQEDIEGNYRRHWLLFDLLECYFKLRDAWYFGPKESFSWLKANDRKVYQAFEAALQPAANLGAIEKLITCVLLSNE